MPDLLEFNPDRDLLFDPDRELAFSPDRARGFDQERDLGFDPERGLPFGKKGVVFRGYVCPVCGAAVTADAPSCTDCGAVFEPKKAAPPKPKAPPAPTQTRLPPPPPPEMHRPPPPPPPVRAYPPPPKRIETQSCVYCGARVSGADVFCWNCGNRMHGGR